MRDEDDPFLSVMRFLEGSHPRARRLGAWLEDLTRSAELNAFMVLYIFVSAVVFLILASNLLLLSGNQSLVDVGGFFHAGAGLIQLCHQLPYRSFLVSGVPMAVCSRDTGIYVGSVLGFATVLAARKPDIFYSVKLPILASAPMAVDGVTQTVLALRESSQFLRVVTGLAFGFGVFAYLVNRFFERRYPDFRERVLSPRWLVADAFVAFAFLYVLLSQAGVAVDVDFMGKQEALTAASRLHGDEAEYVNAYYVSSMAVLSAQADPYYPRHRDLVLDDLVSTEWVRSRMEAYTGVVEEPQVPESGSLEEAIREAADSDHRFGVWAVVFSDEEPEKGSAPYVEDAVATIYYLDPVTKEAFMNVTHR